MLIRGKIPSSKLLNFLCELAEGKFITNEKLQEIESRINKIKELQERIKMLEEEVQSVKTLHNNVEVKLAEMSAQKEKFEHQYIETKKKLDERSKKLDSSSINNIVTFE